MQILDKTSSITHLGAGHLILGAMVVCGKQKIVQQIGGLMKNK